MPVDPEHMPSAPSLGATIAEDRPCVRCGYNLVGLETHGACPECGTAITPRRKRSARFADNLVNSEMWYLKTLAVGMGLMACAVIGVTLLRLGGWIGSIPKPAEAAGAVLLALVWFAASWLSTVKRPHTETTVKDEILDNDHLRTAARYSQAIVVLAALADGARLFTGNVVFTALYGLLGIAFLFSLVPLSVYLSSLADWAGETGVGSRLRTSAWCITVCGTLAIVGSLVVLMPVPFKLLIGGAATILWVVVLVGLVLFCASTIQLAHTAGWAITNSHQSREREIRIAERKRRQAEADAARAIAADVALAEVANPHHDALADDDSPIPVDGLERGVDPPRGVALGMLDGPDDVPTAPHPPPAPRRVHPDEPTRPYSPAPASADPPEDNNLNPYELADD